MMLTKRASCALFGLLGCALLVCGPAPLAAQEASALDINQYEPTFSEDFNSLSVSPRGSGDAHGQGTRWIAHTPWNGDFGDAAFTDPQPGFPFTVKDGILRIEARKGPDGKWRSGLLSADDAFQNGFKQALGYFEISAKLPEGPGTWPAFWIVSRISPNLSAEIDVLEQYGHDPAHFQSVVHVWKKEGGKDKELYSALWTSAVPAGSLSDRFNTFGVELGKEWVVFYLNRKEVWRTPSRPEFQEPFYPLVNLALGSGWPIDKTPNPSFMYVDYIRVYRKK